MFEWCLTRLQPAHNESRVLMLIPFLLAACVVPPAVMLTVWRGAPPLTVAEVLHAVEGGSHVTSQR